MYPLRSVCRSVYMYVVCCFSCLLASPLTRPDTHAVTHPATHPDTHPATHDVPHPANASSRFSFSVVTSQANASVASEFHVRTNHPSLCDEKDVFLMIAVCSASENAHLRQAIRETWASDLATNSKRIKLIFLLGLPQQSSLQESIGAENQKYGDIVQVDFVDSYKNLTLKSIAMLHWIHTFCPHAAFVLKADDDIFINIPLLVADLSQTVHTHFIMGHLIAGAKPDREPHSKWYTPETVYPHSQYPEYISGCAYVLSGDLVGALAAVTGRVPLYWVEDVYITAMCAAQLPRAKHLVTSKFGYKRRDPCQVRNVITSHRQTPHQMRTLWKVMTSGTYC